MHPLIIIGIVAICIGGINFWITKLIDNCAKDEEDDYWFDDMIPNDPEDCPHYSQIIKPLGGSVNCETTVLKCMDCGKILSEPKTDC